jgi:hypothetical protein
MKVKLTKMKNQSKHMSNLASWDMGFLSQIFHHCDKIPDKNNLREERFILAPVFI